VRREMRTNKAKVEESFVEYLRQRAEIAASRPALLRACADLYIEFQEDKAKVRKLPAGKKSVSR